MSESTQQIRWKFVKKNKDFFNWSDCTFAVKDTNDALFQYARQVSQTFLNTWREKDNLYHFVTDNYSHSGELDTPKDCETCKRVFADLEPLKKCPLVIPYPGSDLSYPGSDLSWTLLKLFADKRSRNLQNFSDCTEKTLYKIIKRCGLFKTLEKDIDDIVNIRNQLMHSRGNELSQENKACVISKMKNVLQLISYDSTAAAKALDNLKKIDYKGQSDTKKHVTTGIYDDMIKAWDIQLKSLDEDIERVNELGFGRFLSPNVRNLVENVRKCKSETEKLKGNDVRLGASISDVIAMGARRARELLGDNLFGRIVGGVTGGVGGFAAGCLKLLSQSDETAVNILLKRETSQSETDEDDDQDVIDLRSIVGKGRQTEIGIEVSNIACISAYLQLSIEISFDIIMDRMNDKISSWSKTRPNGFQEFLKETDNISFCHGRWTIMNGNTTADEILDEIVRLHLHSRKITWKCNAVSDAQHSWILAKMFMAHGNEQMKTIYDVDILSVLDLLQNCRLFKEDFDNGLIGRLRDARNKIKDYIRQTSSADISDYDRNVYLDAMVDFVKLPVLEEASNRVVLCETLERLKTGRVIACDDLEQVAENIKPLLEKQASQTQYVETTCQIFDQYTNIVLANVNEQNDALSVILAKIGEKKTKYTAVGSVAGATVTGGLTVIAGTALGIAAAPVAVVGAVGLALGALGGGVGGSVLNKIKRII